jgi:hypothetical protein
MAMGSPSKFCIKGFLLGQESPDEQRALTLQFATFGYDANIILMSI